MRLHERMLEDHRTNYLQLNKKERSQFIQALCAMPCFGEAYVELFIEYTNSLHGLETEPKGNNE